MADIFLKILNLSISASWLVAAVLILRLLFKKAPKWVNCLLWGIVALRLLIPFSFESAFSLLPSAEVIPKDIMTSPTPAIYSAIPAVNSSLNPLLTEDATTGGNMLAQLLFYSSATWVVGIAVLLLICAATYLKLRLQVRASLQYRQNIYICDNVASPFILGTFRPRIYIPSGMEEEHLQYVLAHENAHIRRKDHWWKPLGYLLLTVYWFNPLLWLAYVLLCRDIERACDEKVISGMDSADKKNYSLTLAACSVHRRTVAACPVAFGEVSVKARIKGILNYKKPALWLIIAAAAACLLTALCFLTVPEPCHHDYHAQIAVAPTCTHTGRDTLTCTQCRHSYTVLSNPLSHTYTRGAVVTEPTCITLGSRALTCSGCGAVKTEGISMTAHTLGAPSVAAEPNCTEEGAVHAACTYCQEVFVTEVLPTNDVHDLHETVLKAATCTATGKGVLECSRCDYTENLTYGKKAHRFDPSGSFSPNHCQSGIQHKLCVICGYETQTIIPATEDHKWVYNYRNGMYYCDYCGIYKSDGTTFVNNNSSSGPTYPVIRWDLANP